MRKYRSVIERVQEFQAKNPQSISLMSKDMNEIAALGNMFDMIKIAFYFGYMKGLRHKGESA